MNDQIIGRKRIDKHHQVRWNILKELEAEFKKVKGQNPKLDVIFIEALKKSRKALEDLDMAAAQKKKVSKKTSSKAEPKTAPKAPKL
jgi:hypothetical protein